MPTLLIDYLKIDVPRLLESYLLIIMKNNDAIDENVINKMRADFFKKYKLFTNVEISEGYKSALSVFDKLRAKLNIYLSHKQVILAGNNDLEMVNSASASAPISKQLNMRPQ